MAGKRHHFIPQFLQTGFISKVDGDTKFTIVYRKDRPPKEIATRHVGVQTHFYNKPDDTFLDDIITKGESSRYLKTVLDLRKGAEVKHYHQNNIAKLISHLMLRSRNLRLSVIKATNPIVDMLIEEFNDPELQLGFIKHLARTQHGINPIIVEMLDSTQISEIVTPIIAEVFNDREFFEKTFKDQTEIAHQEEMKKSIEPKAIVEALMKFEYQVIAVDQLPLGDSMVIFCVLSKGCFHWKTIISKGDKCIYVVLPISSNQLLVGYKEDFSVKHEDIRSGIIECSYEFFISSELKPSFVESTKKIGLNSNLVTPDEFEKEMKKLRISFGI